ncbi:MAG: hypothetical protein HY055_03230 [Magnetospirillum sp.]|nr:hypothetical protein [Magnetospirillum sp.]
MRRPLYILAGLSLCLTGWGAAAQQVSSGSGPMVITITKTDCSRLIQHTPAPDVAYKPGVDVRGKPVVSADTDPGRAEMNRKMIPETLEFPVNINPMNYGARKSAYKSKASTESAIAAGGGTATAAQSKSLATAESKIASLSGKGYDNTSASVGVVKYDIARNSFTFNGEPLVSDDQRALAAACSKQGVR